jgi:hypothetical protein
VWLRGSRPVERTTRKAVELNWSGATWAGTQCRRVTDAEASRDSGAVLLLGHHDWPIAPLDPRAIMGDAQLRRRSEAAG